MVKLEKIQTEVEGLDDMLFGGIPVNNQVLLSGGPGSGKTLLSLEIMYRIAKRGVPCTFLTFEEPSKLVIRNFKETFPELSDIDDLIASRKLIIDGDEVANKIQVVSDSQNYSFGNILSDVESILQSNDSKVLTFDSISSLKLMIEDKVTYRRAMISFSANLRRLDITSILTTETSTTERNNISFGHEFFVFDGIIALYEIGQEDKRIPSIEILKMRGSNHSWSLSPYNITPTGFKIYTLS